jgi:hypothetical protein
MAGETLQDSLSGLRFSGADNAYGLGASTLASSLPALINPRSSVGRNLAIGLGGTLLTALLGYQARQQASEDTIATMGYGNQILGAASPEEQFAIATAVEDTQQKAKLLTLVNALKTNETVNKLNNQVKQADMIRDVEQARLIAEANQGLQLGEQGTAIFNRENQAAQDRALQVQTAMQDRALAMQAARAAAKPAPSSVAAPSSIAWFKDISPGQLEPLVTAKGTTVEMLQLASDFEKLKQNALEFQSTVNIAGTPANLAYSRLAAIIPRIVRLGGATGAMSDMEEKRIMSATIGNMSSGTASIAERIKGLTVSALNMAGERAKSLDTMFKPLEGASLYDTLEFGSLNQKKGDDKEAYKQSLIAQLAAKRRGN